MDAILLDNQERKKKTINQENLLDRSLTKDTFFHDVEFRGFKFFDPEIKSAFEFDNRLFDAQSLAMIHEWLRSLDDQSVAEQIGNDKKLELVKNYPDHHLKLNSYRSPRYRNYNLPAGVDNTDIHGEETLANYKNLAAIRDYQKRILEAEHQIFPDEFKPSSEIAYEAEQPGIDVYFAEIYFNQAFLDDDPDYTPSSQATRNKLNQSHSGYICSSCHNGSEESPDPNFADLDLDPLNKSDWIALFDKKDEAMSLFCDVKSRIESPSVPMPPSNSDQYKVFEPIKSESIQMLEDLEDEYSLGCP